jgi:hypothetical protein
MEHHDLLRLGTVHTDDYNGTDIRFKTSLDRDINQVLSRWIYRLLNRSYPRLAKLLCDRN